MVTEGDAIAVWSSAMSPREFRSSLPTVGTGRSVAPHPRGWAMLTQRDPNRSRRAPARRCPTPVIAAPGCPGRTGWSSGPAAKARGGRPGTAHATTAPPTIRHRRAPPRRPIAGPGPCAAATRPTPPSGRGITADSFSTAAHAALYAAITTLRLRLRPAGPRDRARRQPVAGGGLRQRGDGVMGFPRHLPVGDPAGFPAELAQLVRETRDRPVRRIQRSHNRQRRYEIARLACKTRCHKLLANATALSGVVKGVCQTIARLAKLTSCRPSTDRQRVRNGIPSPGRAWWGRGSAETIGGIVSRRMVRVQEGSSVAFPLPRPVINE